MDPLDRLFMERAYELAERGEGNTSPNPPVGAVIVRDGRVVGEGFHHRAGEPHAEVLALAQAGDEARGATLYVSLEPCNHHGRTPPCTQAVAAAGVRRVAIGTTDPNPMTAGGGVGALRDRGIEVDVADDDRARAIVESFARAIASDRPYVTLKMATSIDGFVASRPGAQEWLTGEEARAFVRDLRISHDAVMVGANTIRIDDPQLTVRPAHRRLRDYVRVVACEREPVDPSSAVFAASENYAKTIVIVPAGARDAFRILQNVADVVFVGDDSAASLDLATALRELQRRGLSSVLCEGGPTLAGGLLSRGLVDRVQWIVAPRLLRSETAVAVLKGAGLGDVRGIAFDRVERLGPDVLLSGRIDANV